MKKIELMLVSALALIFAACQEKPVPPDTPYIIEGEVTSVEDGTIMVLYEEDGIRLAMDTIINGKFSFKSQINDGNSSLYLSLHVGKTYSSFVNIHVKPGIKVKITGDGFIPELWEIDCSTPRQLITNELNIAAREEIAAYDKLDFNLTGGGMKGIKMNDVDRLFAAYQAVVGKKLERLRNMQVSDEWMEELLYYLKYNARQASFPHRELFVSLYGKLSDTQKQSVLGQEIYTTLNPPQQAKVGEPFPDADFYDLQGNLHHISEFKGKYVLLDFWSRGCRPCLQSFPIMKEMYEQVGDKLAIISISIDSEEHWRIASEKHEITWNNWNELKGKAGLYTNYRINAIPFYVLINPEGKIMDTIRGFNRNYILESIGE